MDILKRFVNFVELNTKIASLMPFLVGLAYALYSYGSLNIRSTLIFFVAMLLFDMATTAINNYIDNEAAKKKGHFSKTVSLAMIFFMLISSSLLGLYLTYLHGLVLLLTGIFCFVIGICYTFGPIPISRSAYGEIFSGTVMGVCIPFLAVLINSPANTLISLQFSYPEVNVLMNIENVVKLGIVTVPLICCIANIMLANNICDVEKDVVINRYTLPFYIGQKNALLLFAGLYYIAYAAIIIASIVGIIPLYSVVVLLTLKVVQKNINLFFARPVKSETFVLSVANFVFIAVPYFIFIFIGSVIS